ncbi:nucleoside monophosphate kinase [Patescibacteria group bacterium]|nr:nucleoside monophosphate kinase [Patescibacteria group bacterium]
MSKPKIIILLGRSGSGKGTQAKLLTKDFKFDYISSGDLLRKRMEKKDFTGKKIKKFVNRGDLVPAFLIFNNWVQELEKCRDKKNIEGILIDGSPRRVNEAELLDAAFDWFEYKEIKVILIDISQKEAFDRLTKRRMCKMCGRLIPWTGTFKDLKVCDQCGGELIERADDTPAAIRKRMDFFKKEVEPVIKHYQKQKRLVKVNGEQSIEDVYREVKKAIL